MVAKYVRRGGRSKRQMLGAGRQRVARQKRFNKSRGRAFQASFKKRVLSVVRRNKERHFVDTSVVASGAMTYANAARVVPLDGVTQESAWEWGFSGEQARLMGVYWRGTVQFRVPIGYLNTYAGVWCDVYLCTIEGNTLPTAGDFPGANELPDYDFWKNSRIKLLRHKRFSVYKQGADAVYSDFPVTMYAPINRRLNQSGGPVRNFRTFFVSRVAGLEATDSASVTLTGSARLSFIEV